MKHVLQLICLFAVILASVEATQERNEVEEIVRDWSEDYDSKFRPNLGGPSETVGISLYVLAVNQLSELSQDFTIDMYFRQFWNDPRLKFTGPKKIVLTGRDYVDRFWTPDTFFVNEKEVVRHDAMAKNLFFRVNPNGDVLRSERISVKASCPMDLARYPFDTQICYLEIESFAFTMNDIRYKWNDGNNSVQISSDVSLPQMKVVGYRLKTIEASLSTGSYNRLASEFFFVRVSSWTVTTVIVPCMMFVIVSWCALWVDGANLTLRVILTAGPLFILSPSIAALNRELPAVAYTKAIDVYTGCSVTFIFFALLYVLAAARRDNAKGLDRAARIAFPVVFAVFNLSYFVGYGIGSSLPDDMLPLF